MSAVATKQVITHLEYVSVQVKDQEAAKRFYTEALGFEVDEDKSYPDGQRWLTVKAPGSRTKLVLFADPHAHGGKSSVGSTSAASARWVSGRAC